MSSVPVVGWKKPSLGEMISSLKDEGIRVPDGFATTAEAYRRFVSDGGIEKEILTLLSNLQSGDRELDTVGRKIRRLFTRACYSIRRMG
jgi:pyruvate,water dikinase